MSTAKITSTLRLAEPVAAEAVANLAKPRPTLAPAPAPMPPAAALKRLTIDIPEPLHRRIKVASARRGSKMADEIRRLLEEHYPRED
jgi:hypothetical protein